MRGSRGVSSRDILKYHFLSQKPVPIVPSGLIEGCRSGSTARRGGGAVERVRSRDRDKRLVEPAPRRSVVLSLVVKYPRHEQRVKEMNPEDFTGLFRLLLDRYRAQVGRYERVTATALNAYIGR